MEGRVRLSGTSRDLGADEASLVSTPGGEFSASFSLVVSKGGVGVAAANQKFGGVGKADEENLSTDLHSPPSRHDEQVVLFLRDLDIISLTANRIILRVKYRCTAHSFVALHHHKRASLMAMTAVLTRSHLDKWSEGSPNGPLSSHTDPHTLVWFRLLFI